MDVYFGFFIASIGDGAYKKITAADNLKTAKQCINAHAKSNDIIITTVKHKRKTVIYYDGRPPIKKRKTQKYIIFSTDSNFNYYIEL